MRRAKKDKALQLENLQLFPVLTKDLTMTNTASNPALVIGSREGVLDHVDPAIVNDKENDSSNQAHANPC